MRACAGCGTKESEENLLRFVIVDGKPFLDVARKLPGRGYNVCPNRRCIERFLKRRFKGKVRGEEILPEVIRALKSYLLHLLSLSFKAGMTVIGQDRVRKLKNKRGTLILAEELSDKTKERLSRGTELVLDGAFTFGELARAMGRKGRVGVVFVEKVGPGRKLFATAKKLSELLREER